MIRLESSPHSPVASAVPRTASASASASHTSENGNVFTLTNIYTFGESNGQKSASENYRVKSFVEVFHPGIKTDNDRLNVVIGEEKKTF